MKNPVKILQNKQKNWGEGKEKHFKQIMNSTLITQ